MKINNIENRKTEKTDETKNVSLKSWFFEENVSL
jgi:hypothetical protein